MRLTCPSCGFCGDVEAYLADVAARRALAAALQLPPALGDRLLRYLMLFRPAKRALSLERLQRLLEELVAPIREAKLTRHGRTWAAPLAYWEQALEQMLDARDKLQLPLKSHGYLFEIVAGIACKAEAKKEAQAQAAAAYPYARVHTPEAPPSRGIPAEVKEQLQRFLKGGTADDHQA